MRREFTRQTVNAIMKKPYDAIALDGVKPSNLTRTAKGTVEEPGKNVAQKAGLNKAILNIGWAMFDAQLISKCIQRGKVIIRTSPHYTSQQCPSCGHTSRENRKTQSEFECVSCGYENNADTVGAINTAKIAAVEILGACVDNAG